MIESANLNNEQNGLSNDGDNTRERELSLAAITTQQEQSPETTFEESPIENMDLDSDSEQAVEEEIDGGDAINRTEFIEAAFNKYLESYPPVIKIAGTVFTMPKDEAEGTDDRLDRFAKQVINFITQYKDPYSNYDEIFEQLEAIQRRITDKKNEISYLYDRITGLEL